MTQVEKILQTIEAVTTQEELEDLIAKYMAKASQDETFMAALLEVAEFLKRSGYRDFSLHLLEELYNLHPGEWLAYLIAESYHEYLLPEKAKAWIDLLPEKEDPTIELLRAKILSDHQDAPAAMDIYLALIQKFPTESAPYEALAQLFYDHQEWERAEYYYQVLYDYFDTVVEVAPIRERLLELELSKEMVQKDRMNELYKEVEEFTTAQEPYQLALGYERAGDAKRSAEYLRQAIEMDPDHLNAQVMLLDLALENDWKQEVQGQLEWLGDNLPPYDERILHLVQTLPENIVLPDALTTAMVDYLGLINDQEDLFKALEILANTFIQKDRPSDFLDLLNQVFENHDNQKYFQELYGQIYYAQGETVKAFEAFDEAYEHQQIQEKNLVIYEQLLIENMKDMDGWDDEDSWESE